jgi:nucleotide-binding universal stress UspA family protein
MQILIGYFLILEIKQGLVVFGAAFLWILIGCFVYFAYSEKKKAEKLEEIAKTVYEEMPIKEFEFGILVPIANPEYADKLIKLASLIAKQREGEVILLNVVTIPDQTPPSGAIRYVESAKNFLSELIRGMDVPAGGIVKIGHSVSEAILNTVEEIKPNLIIMGWRGRTFRKDFVLGSTIDPVLLRAKCDVAVVRFEPTWKEIKKILISTAGGPHAVLAAELARDLAKQTNASITLLYVGKSEEDRKKAEKAFKETLKPLEGLKVNTKFLIDRNVVDRIAKESEKHNIVLIGTTNQPFLKNFLLGVFPEKVVSRTRRTVVMTRRWVRLIRTFK